MALGVAYYSVLPSVEMADGDQKTKAFFLSVGKHFLIAQSAIFLLPPDPG